ncbi:AI-2E family transporter [Corynebacterium sp. H128]|uniref:AI-2E family transporter n=1 Tax=Corynebacterium sp. H128 TaxID=3133427 RepID=UPI00403EF9DD
MDIHNKDNLDKLIDLPEQLGAEPLHSERIDRAAILGQDGRWVAGWALRFVILAIAGFIAWKGLGKVWTGLLPILLAILVSTVLWPPVKWLRSKKWPPALAVTTVLLVSIGTIVGIFTAMAPSIGKQSKELVDKASEGLDKLETWLQGPPFNLNIDQITGFLNDIMAKAQEQASNIASGVAQGVSTASSVLVTLGVMLVLTFFFLKDGDRFLPWIRRTTGANAGWHLTEALTRTWNTLAGYIRAQAIVSLIDAIIIGTGLVILGVPLAFVLGVLTFFAGFIPIVGAVTAGALAVLVALVSNGTTTAIFVLILIIAVQQLEGNVLSPILQSKAMNLHPAIVLLSVTVGSSLFGIIGAFLAVPVAASIAVWLRYHGDLVSLRSGELTVDEIQIETSRAAGNTATAEDAFEAIRDKFSKLGRRRPPAEAPAGLATKVGAPKVDPKGDPEAEQ